MTSHSKKMVCIGSRHVNGRVWYCRLGILHGNSNGRLRMRLLGMIIVSVLAVAAQIDLVDPEYVIPKENPYTMPADLERGGQVFRGQCARCHGPKGEGGLGAILAQPRLRHAADDQSLFKVIRDGIKGTEMPPGLTLTSREIWQLAAYIR